MNRDTKPIYWILLGIIAVGILIVALRPGRSETTVLPPLDLPDPSQVASDEGLVIARFETGGTEIFGLHFGTVHHRLEVQFYAPEGCYDAIASGDTWPPGIAECTTDVVITGEIAGGGRTATGESIVGVLVDVSAQCYDATPRGALWPLAAPECAVES